jgi:hypothetical protein
MQKWRIVTSGVSGGRSLTRPVSRRPPIPLGMIVALPRATRLHLTPLSLHRTSSLALASRQKEARLVAHTLSLTQARLTVRARVGGRLLARAQRHAGAAHLMRSRFSRQIPTGVHTRAKGR